MGREEPRVEWKTKFPRTQSIFFQFEIIYNTSNVRQVFRIIEKALLWTPTQTTIYRRLIVPKLNPSCLICKLDDHIHKATLESAQKQTLASTTDSTTAYHCNGDSRSRNQKLTHVDIYSPNELQDQPPEPQQLQPGIDIPDNSLQNNLREQQTVLHKWPALRWRPWRVQPQQHICNLRKYFVYCQGNCCRNFL